MSDVITIAGSPSTSSRSGAVLAYVREALGRRGLRSEALVVRELPAEDLILARADSPALAAALERVRQARGVVVATPVYKAAYSGVLKTFLDLLPGGALAGKVVLPIASGASPAHLLALDYALKPVLAALGAQYTLAGVYLVDSQILAGGEQVTLAPELSERLDQAVADLAGALGVSG